MPEVAFLIRFAIYCAVLGIIGIVLVLWVYPSFLPARLVKPLSGLTVLILVLLALLRLTGVVTWPI